MVHWCWVNIQCQCALLIWIIIGQGPTVLTVSASASEGCVYIFSSPEHEVLMVSYCDQSMSVVRRQQFVLKANSS